jgi:hypothetical protein
MQLNRPGFCFVFVFACFLALLPVLKPLLKQRADSGYNDEWAELPPPLPHQHPPVAVLL